MKEETMTSRLPGRHCPVCRAEIDGQTSVAGQFTPKPGDVTVCLYCQSILIFTEDLQTRIASYDEMLQLRQSEVWPMLVRLRMMASETAAKIKRHKEAANGERERSLLSRSEAANHEGTGGDGT